MRLPDQSSPSFKAASRKTKWISSLQSVEAGICPESGVLILPLSSLVRSALHRLGYRFRLNRKDLPGKPDIVLPKHKLAIFVHGCYWHRHAGCKNCSLPKSNIPFWINKFEKNVARDSVVDALLKEAGWRTITVWECEAKKSGELPRLLSRLVGRAIKTIPPRK